MYNHLKLSDVEVAVVAGTGNSGLGGCFLSAFFASIERGIWNTEVFSLGAGGLTATVLGGAALAIAREMHNEETIAAS